VPKEWLRALSGGNRRNDEAERKLEPYLRDDNARVLLRLVLENPDITPDSLAKRSRADKDLVNGHLDRMVTDGLIVIEKEGDSAGCHIAGAAKAAVAEHLPLNYQCPGMMRE
jgi:predicted HTH transcriptional regulator